MFGHSHTTVHKGFDNVLIIFYGVLILIGWLTIYSTSYKPGSDFELFSLNTYYGRQLIWILISVATAIAILLIDNKLIQTYAYPIYIFFLLLNILVLFLGTEISGAKAWIKIGSISLQPIEFAKFATALALAKLFSESKTSSEKKMIWIYAFILILIPAGIALLQDDTGSALVFFSFIILFYREGFRPFIIFLGFLAILLFIFTIYFNELYTITFLVIALIISFFINNDKKYITRNILVFIGSIILIFAVNYAYNDILQPHQRQRIDTILGKSVDPKGADFNLNQSKIAIGSGGFFGKGYLKGTQTKLNFVPEQRTDFIFCGIGEEWGFLGCVALIAIYLALIIRLITQAEKQRNAFVRVYGYGVASVFFFHLFVNIGMTIGLMQVIGIPLPLISYGGSSLWGFTILLFIFIRLQYNNN